MFNQVEKVLKEKVRPKLLDHYGDIKLIKVENNVVEVKLLGACSGCPSAQFTIEDIVEASLKEEIPEIEKVVLVNEVSQELLDMARKILNRKVD
ncbi:NifU family protein [Wukongibacter sp. M2B1]|uniref:NifU family protein n=1 Tax=Wukongibacter sp. M2B1 TaxID=3088895 RepID=UPI003D7B8E1E